MRGCIHDATGRPNEATPQARTVEGFLFAATAVLQEIADHRDIAAEGGVEERSRLPPGKVTTNCRPVPFSNCDSLRERTIDLPRGRTSEFYAHECGTPHLSYTWTGSCFT